MVLFDTHTHLNMNAYDGDLEEVVDRASASGVTKILDVGTDLSSSRKAVRNCRRFDGVYAAVGIHPHDADKTAETDLAEIEHMLDQSGVVALGEIGLDYHYDFSPRNVQKKWFGKQLDLARTKNKPVVIHVREAMPEGLAVIDDLETIPAGVFHCFGGNRYDVDRVIERGFYISFTGVITFKNFRNRDLIKSVPLNRLLIETDAPYMAPAPFRGKRNEPAYLIHLLTVLSEIYQVDEEEIAHRTSDNAAILFGLER